jgi:predicted 2-oxoglutarate/Fe(II)-dependent dioxygenase YbiX
MVSLKTRIKRGRQNRHKLHNKQQKAGPPPRLHNPYGADAIRLANNSLGDLRLHYKPQTTHVITSALKRQYRQGKFTHLKHDPQKHTLIYGYDNAIIGYRIPAEDVKQNESLLAAVQALSEDAQLQESARKQTSTYRGKYISRNYCVWAPYAAQPFISAHFREDGVSAQRFMADTEGLWNTMSRHFEVLFLSAYKEAVNHALPDGLFPLAGAFMGFAINVQQEDSSVQTEIHRDVQERPYVPSCLCPIGDYRGGDLILWELRTVVELKPGDLFYFYDSLIHHSNEEVEGTRHSIVAFTQQNMFDYWRRKEERQDVKMRELQARQKKVGRKKKHK